MTVSRDPEEARLSNTYKVNSIWCIWCWCRASPAAQLTCRQQYTTTALHMQLPASAKQQPCLHQIDTVCYMLACAASCMLLKAPRNSPPPSLPAPYSPLLLLVLLVTGVAAASLLLPAALGADAAVSLPRPWCSCMQPLTAAPHICCQQHALLGLDTSIQQREHP